MGFQKGNTFGGRKFGSKNKSTEVVKAVYAEALTASTDKLLSELNSLSGAEYVKCYLAISKFLIPTLAAKTVEAVVSQGMPEWVERLDNISDEDIDRILSDK